jgi:nuclear transport factor 2 (NTF2) superfamily protein
MPEISGETLAMFTQLYEDFNARHADMVLAQMSQDVHWPNGWEGGYVEGREAVKEYWTRQWAEIDPRVTPVELKLGAGGRIDVTVHQLVKDHAGSVLSDSTVHHVYQLDQGVITRMEIQE